MLKHFYKTYCCRHVQYTINIYLIIRKNINRVCISLAFRFFYQLICNCLSKKFNFMYFIMLTYIVCICYVFSVCVLFVCLFDLFLSCFIVCDWQIRKKFKNNYQLNLLFNNCLTGGAGGAKRTTYTHIHHIDI